MRHRWIYQTLIAFAFTPVVSIICVADDRRAAAPIFTKDQTQGVFFDSLSDAIRGQRPTVSQLKGSAAEAAEKAKVAAEANDPSGDSGWQQIVSAASLEDEVKRTRLAFDATVTSPGAFKSKGHREARQQLSVLATLFAVINDYTGDIRWKSQAAVARDLIARTALSCNAGSTQSYNEAKIRKAELQELVSGRGFEGRTAEPQNDWAMIVDRTPLMVYGESLLEALQDDTRDEKSYRAAPDDVLRQSELLAMLGRVLVQEGLDDADDEDYAAHSNKMSDAAISVLDAIRRDDFDAIRRGVGAISQSCAACHEDYR